MKGKWPLHEACSRGDAEEVARLLERRADINSQEPRRGNTPLHVAICFRKSAVIERLIKHPQINLNIQNTSAGMSVLHYSVLYFPDPSLLKKLLDLKAEVNLQDNEWRTSCHFALFVYNTSLFSLLLDSRQVDVYVQDKTGMNLVQLAQHTLGEKDERYLISDIKYKAGPSKAAAVSMLLGTKQPPSSVYLFKQNDLYDKQLWRIIFDFAGIPRTKQRTKETHDTWTWTDMWKRWCNFWSKPLNPPVASNKEDKVVAQYPK